MSVALADVSVIGLEALDRAVNEMMANRQWLEPKLASLDAARETHGQTELVVIDPIVALVCAVSLPDSLTVEGCQEKKDDAAGPSH